MTTRTHGVTSSVVTGENVGNSYGVFRLSFYFVFSAFAVFFNTASADNTYQIRFSNQAIVTIENYESASTVSVEFQKSSKAEKKLLFAGQASQERLETFYSSYDLRYLDSVVLPVAGKILVINKHGKVVSHVLPIHKSDPYGFTYIYFTLNGSHLLLYSVSSQSGMQGTFLVTPDLKRILLWKKVYTFDELVSLSHDFSYSSSALKFRDQAIAILPELDADSTVDVEKAGESEEKAETNTAAKVEKGFFASVKIKYKRTTFELISAKNGKYNATYLIHPDGTAVRFENGYFKEKFLKAGARVSEDGIFSLKGASRQLDLDRFYAEAVNQTRKPKKVKKASLEQSMVDPEEYVRSTFRDLTEEAREKIKEGKPARLKNTEEFTRRIRLALAGVEKKNFAVIGEPGVGKSTALAIFARDVAEGKFPEIPRTRRIFAFSADALSQGTGIVGTGETNTAAVLAYCLLFPGTILFTDELHSLRGQGTHMGNANDVFQSFKAAMASGEMVLGGATTVDEFYEAFSSDPALLERFLLILKEEPKDAELMETLRSWISSHGLPAMSEENLRFALYLSEKYNRVGAQPRKTISFLDAVYARQRLAAAFNPKKIRAPSAQDILDTACEFYRKEVAQFENTKNEDLLRKIMNAIDAEVIGNAEAKQAIEDALAQALTGIADPARPLGGVLLAGLKGTAKSLLARTVAKVRGVGLVEVHMNSENLEQVLNTIAAGIRKDPFSVVFIDELEKAPIWMQNQLLQFLENKVFRVSEMSQYKSRKVKVDSGSAFVILAANAGSEFIEKNREERSFGFAPAAPSKTQTQREFREALVADMISELLVDRIPYVVPMRSASRSEFTDILKLHLHTAAAQIEERLKTRITFKDEARYLEVLTQKHYKPGISGRDAVRVMQEELRKLLAKRALKGAVPATLALAPDESGEALSICERKAMRKR